MEGSAMAKMVKKSFSAPEETRQIDKGTVQVVDLDGVKAMRVTFQPGWRWSTSVKHVAKTESCQVAHLNYVLSGRMVVRMDDGTETEFGPGDVGVIPPGHDAWVVGNEPL